MKATVARRVRFVAAASAGVMVVAVGATPSLAATPKVAKAPAALLATTLLKAAKLATVLPGVAGKQDDGGWLAQYPEPAFVSEVETQAPLTHLKVTLSAYGSKKLAAVAYTSDVNGQPKLGGVGDRAVVSADLQTMVLKGSQVLLVEVSPTLAGDDLIAQQGKSQAVNDQVLQHPLLTATKALAHHLNGKPATKPYSHLPAGAVDPCGVTAANLKSAKIKTVTFAGGPSERTPAQQCDYTINGAGFLVQTLTQAQARAAAPATTLDAVYAADLAATAGNAHKTLTATIGPIRMFMVPGDDWIAEAIIETPATSVPTTSVRGVRANQGLELHPELLRAERPQSVPTTYELCVAFWSHELQRAWNEAAAEPGGKTYASYPKSTASPAIIAYCKAVSGGAGR